MAASYLQNLRILVAKQESTPGTAETLTSADFDVRIRNPEITINVEQDDEASKYARGDHGEDDVVMGAQSGTISFAVRAAWSGTANAAPEWGKFFESCGAVGSAYTTVGYGYRPVKDNDEKTMTIWVYDIQRGATPKAVLYKYTGCIGTAQIGAEGVGKPWMIKFTFSGKLTDVDFNVANASIPFLNNLDASCTDKMLNNAMTIDSVATKISSFALDLGNEVQPMYDQSDSTGISHFGIVSRKPRFACNPLVAEAVDVYGNLSSGLTGCANMPVISIAANHFSLKVPKAQLITANVNAREGLVGWEQTWKCIANGVTGALSDSVLPAEATWELLIGSRT